MADALIITCSECQKKFKGKASLQGKKIRCPFCKESFVVSGKPVSAKAKGAPDEDEYGDSNPYGITHLDLAPRCPNCANEMANEEAVVCLFCGYNTLTRTWGKTEKIIATTGGEHFLYLFPGLAAAFGIFVCVLLLLFLDVVLPGIVERNTWWAYLDHESIRLWATIIMLSMIWGMGQFALKRLILNPQPPEKFKD